MTMHNKKPTEQNQEEESKKSILGSLFSRQKLDKAYLSDLRLEWHNMSSPERIKFILGAFFGLILFVGALIGVFLILTAIAG
ncbi:MAG: hypothetical protein ACK2TV_10995 [Anaerolineales bacterium]